MKRRILIVPHPPPPCPVEIYSATAICRKSLTECIQVEDLMQNEWAENRLADFNLWASGLGASVYGKASLDARLIQRPDARDAVTNLLQMLTGAVEDCRSIVRGSVESSTEAGCDEDHPSSDSGEDPPRAFSPWSDDTESGTDLEYTLNDSSPLHKAKETVNSLLDLLVRIAITIRRSGTHSRLRKADRKFKLEEHEELQRHLVIVMLSQGPFSSDHTFASDQIDPSKLTPIQWRLIKCNLKRRNRFLYAQKHSEALDTPKNPPAERDPTAKPKEHDLAPRSVDDIPVPEPAATSVAMAKSVDMTRSVATATSASGVTGLPAGLPTLPKGPASSHATRTQLSTTVHKLPYPHPPKGGKQANAFSCPCCCQTLPVGILETSRWKKHLTEDIQPYTCVLSGCPSPELLYVSRKDWELHLKDDHGSTDMWICFACLDSLEFEAEADFVAHTLQEHSETIAEGQIHALAAACRTSSTADITSCPLCAWPILEEGEVSHLALLDHIAEHVHAFSLRALPWAPDASNETDDGIQRAALKVEPWLEKYNLCSETLMVLVSSDATPVPAQHYFNTHPYFAEGSDNSSCSIASDGTIEHEIREGSPLLFEDFEDEDDVAEPARGDGATEEIVVQSPMHGYEYVSRSLYEFGRIIGSGNRSVVRRSDSGYDRSVAIKCIDKGTVKDKVHEIYQEIELWQYVKHPNIVGFVDWFESKNKYGIVTDLVGGGTLLERITEEGRLSEPDAQHAVRNILASVAYLHHHGIVNRHLTVQKFVYLTRDESSPLILTSLAHADWEKTEDRRVLLSVLLTDSFRSISRSPAPEILRRERSGKPADMWSIGIMTYLILAGCSLFESKLFDDLYAGPTMGRNAFDEHDWMDISGSAQDFIRRLLQPEPEDRLTIEGAECHPWITGK